MCVLWYKSVKMGSKLPWYFSPLFRSISECVINGFLFAFLSALYGSPTAALSKRNVEITVRVTFSYFFWWVLFLFFILLKSFFCLFFLESEGCLHLAYRVLSVGRNKKFLSIFYDD